MSNSVLSFLSKDSMSHEVTDKNKYKKKKKKAGTCDKMNNQILQIGSAIGSFILKSFTDNFSFSYRKEIPPYRWESTYLIQWGDDAFPHC